MLVITPVYHIIMQAMRDHEPIRGQNFETSIWKKLKENCSCHIELQLVCVGQQAAATNGLSIQKGGLLFFMQSNHLERGSKKITIGLFHYISTNANYPRLENLYKMLIDHLHKMAQAI